MCGITGYLPINKRTQIDRQREIGKNMADAIQHRGPDGAGLWIDEENGLVLAHRRLAIIDLSSAGHQPMRSACGRYTLVYNGEIYNHLQIRHQLSAESSHIEWRSLSDTETLLVAFSQWGVEATLHRCLGMFAFCLWDRTSCTLTFARDRIGEKPLYYGWVGTGEDQAFVFGSEIKALRAHPSFSNPVCRKALAQYLRFLYVPAPLSIYENIYKLEPGCLLKISLTNPVLPPPNALRPGQEFGQLNISRWWALSDVVTQGACDKFTEKTLLQQLELTLSDAVKGQSIADVPLGAFLSGGVDSSTIVALMQKQARENGASPVQTFTIGFDESIYDESHHARSVAKHLGTEHSEVRVTSYIAQDLIPSIPSIYDEPFADSSQLPTYLVCKAARQKVTVALSGDAGDELFCGYNRYLWGPRIWSLLGKLPYPLRQTLSKTISSLPPPVWDSLGSPFKHQKGGGLQLSEKVQKLANAIDGVSNLEEFYRNLVSSWTEPSSLVKSINGGIITEASSLLDDPLPEIGLEDSHSQMMYMDTMTYLPDDILCKVDRASMACSLETRVPFLDHRVVELAWQMPMDMKLKGKTSKWAIRQLLYKHVPRELIERPKAGFAIPLDQWLRGPLREWAEGLLSERRLMEDGYFYSRPIRKVWTEHLAGTSNHANKLWAVLIFQAWLEAQK